jgi:hypothetical protein
MSSLLLLLLSMCVVVVFVCISWITLVSAKLFPRENEFLFAKDKKELFPVIKLATIEKLIEYAASPFVRGLKLF